MKKELIIISDLWGQNQSDWLRHFDHFLSDQYAIKFYDACVLGEIDTRHYEEKSLHRQFVEFGIERAIHQLLTLEHRAKTYIGCSVGGVIAWKAALQGLPLEKLITISSTRLRKESEKPNCPIQMYFGALDPYKPSSDWIKTMGKENCTILPGGHGTYQNHSSVRQILQSLNQKQWIDLK